MKKRKSGDPSLEPVPKSAKTSHGASISSLIKKVGQKDKIIFLHTRKDNHIASKRSNSTTRKVRSTSVQSNISSKLTEGQTTSKSARKVPKTPPESLKTTMTSQLPTNKNEKVPISKKLPSAKMSTGNESNMPTSKTSLNMANSETANIKEVTLKFCEEAGLQFRIKCFKGTV